MIIQTANVSTIRRFCERLNADSLVLWDVDGTLIYANDVLFYPQNLGRANQDALIHELEELENKKLDPMYIRARWYDAFRQLPFLLMDKELPGIIKDLQSRSITNIAITLLKTCTYDGRSFMDWRRDQLKYFGIDFSPAFASYGPMEMPEILEAYGLQASVKDWIYPPLYDKGILLAAQFSKDFCLASLLRRIDFCPKRILFVDDLLENIQMVAKYCEGQGIDFIGIHYTAYQDLPNGETWSLGLIKKKWEYYQKNNVWLMDANASGCIIP